MVQLLVDDMTQNFGYGGLDVLRVSGTDLSDILRGSALSITDRAWRILPAIATICDYRTAFSDGNISQSRP